MPALVGQIIYASAQSCPSIYYFCTPMQWCKHIGILALLSLMVACNTGTQPKEEATPAPATEQNPIDLPQLKEVNDQIKADPNNAELRFQRASAYARINDIDRALGDLEAALRIDPKPAKFYLLKSDLYFKTRDISRAILALEDGTQRNPDSEELLLTTSLYYYYISEYEKSIVAADKALMVNPSSADAYFQKALIFTEIGDTNKAISNLQTTIEQDPTYTDAYIELGNLLSKRKDPLAVKYFENALQTDPQNYEALYGIGKYYQDKEKYTEALAIYDSIIAMDMQFEKAHFNKGWIYFQLDSLAKADDLFQVATGLSPAYADAYYMRGLIAEARGDFKKAELFYGQTLKLHPEHNMAILGFGRLKEKRK